MGWPMNCLTLTPMPVQLTQAFSRRMWARLQEWTRESRASRSNYFGLMTGVPVGPEPVEGTSWPIPAPRRPETVLPPPSTPPVALGQGRWGTPGLFENQGPGSSLAEGGSPPSYGMGVPFQRLRCRRCQALGQEQHGVPPLPLPGRGRQNHPTLYVLHLHLPLFQRPVYLPDSHQQLQHRKVTGETPPP